MSLTGGYLSLPLVLFPINNWKGISKQDFREKVTFSVKVEVVDTVCEDMLYCFGIHDEENRALQSCFVSTAFARCASESYVEWGLQADDVSMLTGPFPLELSKLACEHLVDIACKEKRACQSDQSGLDGESR